MSSERSSLSRPVLYLSILVFAVVWAWLALTAGDVVAAHVDASGTVTRWDSKWSFLSVIGAIGGGMAVFFVGWRFLAPKIPGHAINLPSEASHKYWTAEENRPRFDVMIAEDLEWIGAATFVLLSWVLAVVGSARGDDVGNVALAVPTVLYTVGVIGYCMAMVFGKRYRVQ